MVLFGGLLLSAVHVSTLVFPADTALWESALKDTPEGRSGKKPIDKDLYILVTHVILFHPSGFCKLHY